MAYIVNTNIENQTKNGYLLDAKNVKGTFVVVADTTEMNALKTLSTIIDGSLCYNQADQLFYQYNNNEWNPIQFGGGGNLEGIIVSGGSSIPSTITDLTGYVWTGKDTINLYQWPFAAYTSGDSNQTGQTINITFTDILGKSYTGMYLSSAQYSSDDYYSSTLYYKGSASDTAAYDMTEDSGDETEGWSKDDYKTIKFTGGSDATNTQLINYLQNNGTFSRSSYKVTVLGTMSADAFYALSDARLKENFVPFTSNTSILDLPIYTYDFINSPLKNQIGCKAQDLQQICPEIVHTNEEGYLSIQESKIVYLLIDEIKKLKEEINQLKQGG